jgi:uncharacterized protein YhbP (UPF0306 family)
MSVRLTEAAKANIRSVTFEAVITRADGTREDLGRIAYYHRSPIRRLLWRLSKAGRR